MLRGLNRVQLVRHVEEIISYTPWTILPRTPARTLEATVAPNAVSGFRVGLRKWIILSTIRNY